MLGLCIAACKTKNCRDLSSDMEAMITETYSENWRAQFVYCLRWGSKEDSEGNSNKDNIVEIEYKKNGKIQQVTCPMKMLTNKLAKWAPYTAREFDVLCQTSQTRRYFENQNPRPMRAPTTGQCDVQRKYTGRVWYKERL